MTFTDYRYLVEEIQTRLLLVITDLEWNYLGQKQEQDGTSGCCLCHSLTQRGTLVPTECFVPEPLSLVHSSLHVSCTAACPVIAHRCQPLMGLFLFSHFAPTSSCCPSFNIVALPVHIALPASKRVCIRVDNTWTDMASHFIHIHWLSALRSGDAGWWERGNEWKADPI